ncbi:MAG: Ig-like domain-containing protein [Gemmataceae bacterium]
MTPRTAAQAFTITVTAVNDAPTAAAASRTTLEDTAVDVDLAALVGDVETPTAQLTFAVGGAVTGTVALLADGRTARFTPAANANGAGSFTYSVTDAGDGASPARTTGPVTVSVAVTAVNDAPSFAGGGPVSVLEDAAAYSAAWATTLSAGPADETGQTFAFLVSSTNAALFAVAPAVSPAGVLTFTPAADAFGTATVTVALRDGGGTANGGADTSAAQTFTITVAAVNDAPTFTAGGNVAPPPGSGAYSAAWATAVSAGPANESTQTLAFDVTTTNAGLFAVAPAVSPTGVLSFTPAANASGTATVTVRLTDDGGTANGGIDASAPQSFTITLTPATTGGVAVTAFRGPVAGVVTDTAAAGFGGFTAVRGQPVTLSGIFTGGTAGTAFVINWGDGTATAATIDYLAGTFAATRPYVAAGNFTVELSDGAGTVYRTAAMAVAAAEVQGGVLVLGGTGGDDSVSVAPGAAPGSLAVTVNGVVTTYPAPAGGFARVAVFAQDGNDAVTVAGALALPAWLDGGGGSDTLAGGGGADTLVGGTGDDWLRAVAGDDVLLGGDGNDTLRAGAGNDRVFGDAGNDSIVGGSGTDSLFGGAGDDTIVGGSGSDTLDGGAGNDSLVGGGGGDLLLGGDGDDTLRAGSGGDELLGGAGNDSLVGGSGADSLDGGGGDDSLFGGGGADTILGGAGNDALDGGDGDDVFLGWGGVFVDDVLAGGGGYDQVVNPGESGGLSLAYFGPDLGIEEIAGAAGAADQHVAGTAAANVLNFSQTSLTSLLYVDGRGGNDSITASALTSGMRYVGGGGGDLFAVTAAAAGTEAVIDDFKSGTDKLDLRALGVTAANLTFVAAGADRLVRIQLANGGVITLRLKNFSGDPPASDFLFT